MSVEQFEELSGLVPWLLGRVWPKRYPELESAFQNFRPCFERPIEYISRTRAEEVGDGTLLSTVGYNPTQWLEQDEFKRGCDAHEYQVYLSACDLMLELTRAANYLCDMTRTSSHQVPLTALKREPFWRIGGPFVRWERENLAISTTYS